MVRRTDSSTESCIVGLNEQDPLGSELLVTALLQRDPSFIHTVFQYFLDGSVESLITSLLQRTPSYSVQYFSTFGMELYTCLRWA